MHFLFIKTILRALILDFEIIFIDESGFTLNNGLYRIWRKRDQEIYEGPISQNKNRSNLILSIGIKNIVCWEITKENINENIFKNYIIKMLEKLKELKKENVLLIIDNAKYHKTEKLLKYYKTQKLKILTNIPYKSNFNGIELIFRYIKKITYTKIFIH